MHVSSGDTQHFEIRVLPESPNSLSHEQKTCDHSQDEIISGLGGIQVEGAVQSPALKNHDGIRVESSTRRLLISGPQGVSVQSTAGNVLYESFGNLTLASAKGKVILNRLNMFDRECIMLAHGRLSGTHR